LDLRGVPGLFIASTEFVDAATAQATALGFDVPVHFVAHPIQDRTDAEMVALADEAYAGVISKLVHGPEK